MTITLKIIISSILLLLLIVAGIYLHRTGKPYNIVVFNIHKLFTLGVIVFAILSLLQVYRPAGISTGQVFLVSLICISMLALLVSGAMMSLEKMQISMLWVHRLSTAAFIICYVLMVYFILFTDIQTLAK